jgi:hypothetical protein
MVMLTTSHPHVTSPTGEAEDPADEKNESNDPQDGICESETSKEQSHKQDDQNQSHIFPLCCTRVPEATAPGLAFG